MLRAGDFAERVTFYRVATSADTQGGRSIGTPTTLLSNEPALIESEDGLEGLRAGQRTAEGRYRVRIRYSTTAATITPKDYLTWGSRTLQIESARPDGHRMREAIVFTCLERTS